MSKLFYEQNIKHFESLLDRSSDVHQRRALNSLLAFYRRQLALEVSDIEGAPQGALHKTSLGPLALHQLFSREFKQSPHPCMIIDPKPGLRIVDVNLAYEKATFIFAEDVAGKRLFEVFPDNEAQSTADGVSNLFASLKKVAETGEPDAMPIQRYDVRDADGRFIERYWQPVNSPLFDPKGQLVFLLHHVEDVTKQVRQV
jgi:PAS domain-containing protein